MKYYLTALLLIFILNNFTSLKVLGKEDYPCSKEYHVNDILFERCFHLANGLRAIGDYEGAMSNFYNLLRSAEKHNDLYRIAQLKLHIGITYDDMYNSMINNIKQTYSSNYLSLKDSLELLSYLDYADENIQQSISLFDSVLRKGLKESSYINSKKLSSLLNQKRESFKKGAPIHKIEKTNESINNIKKLSDKFREIILTNMEYNTNVLDYINSNKAKDSVWFNFTKFLYNNKSNCDTNFLQDRFNKLSSLTNELGISSKIDKVITNTESGEITYYLFDGIDPEKQPDLYIYKLKIINYKISELTRETEEFKITLSECQKSSSKLKSDKQNYFGIKAGVNHSFYTGGDSPAKALFNPGFNTGIFLEFGLTNNNRLSLLTEVSYDVKGSKWEMKYLNEVMAFNTYIHYLNFDVIISYKFFLPIYFQTGLHIGYLHDLFELDYISYLLEESSFKATSDTHKYKISVNKFENLNKWDLGLSIGIESENIKLPFWGYLSIGLRYNHSFTDFPIISREFLNYSKLNNNVVELNLKWKFKI